MNLITEVSDRFWLGDPRNLFEKILTVLSLFFGVIKQESVWAEVEHFLLVSWGVDFFFNVDDAAVTKIFEIEESRR